MDFAAPRLSFGTSRLAFGRHAQADDGPATLSRKENARRMMMFREARELLAALPGPGESLYCIQSGSVDLCVLLMAVVGKYAAPCRTLRIATLAYAKRNCVELLGALESGKVGRLVFLCSNYHAAHSRDLHLWFCEELAAFPGCRVGAARSHAKLALFDWADGTGLAVHGSANARTNGNKEQLCLRNDRGLHDWFAAFVDREVENGQGVESDDPGAR